MNSSPGVLNSYLFDITEEFGSTVHVYGISTEPMNSSHESTDSHSNLIAKVDTLTSATHSINANQPKSLSTFLHWWVVKIIEVVGADSRDINEPRKTRS